MRRAYQTDLSDEEWEILKPYLPVPEPPAAHVSIPCARSSTPSSMWCAVAALGGCYLTTSHRGGPFTTTSGPGESTAAPGSGCTKSFTEGRGFDSDETRSPAPG